MQNEILSADTVVHTIGETIPDGASIKPLVPANASAAAAATSSAADLRSIRWTVRSFGLLVIKEKDCTGERILLSPPV